MSNGDVIDVLRAMRVPSRPFEPDWAKRVKCTIQTPNTGLPTFNFRRRAMLNSYRILSSQVQYLMTLMHSDPMARLNIEYAPRNIPWQVNRM